MSELEPTLLLVDDSEVNLDMLSRRLQRKGFIVLTASSGQAALDIVAKQPVDLVVLDLMMPEMDGWTFMAEFKKLPAYSSIPIVVVSQAGNRVLASAPVAAGYLSKPLDRRTLLETIELCLLRRRRDSEA